MIVYEGKAFSKNYYYAVVANYSKEYFIGGGITENKVKSKFRKKSS